ncbi:ABC transporter substrate-binding protein [Paenibacillus tundrae]|uniref:ABC transporter substrate-binding protein n=1 Tax=Paenibacillus tundrae TaxID=528187 RepID=UPI0030CAE25A
MKRRHQIVLFAVLLLSLTILSPSFDFGGSQSSEEGNPDRTTFPNQTSRGEDQHAPVEIVVSMTSEEFLVFQTIANQVADSSGVEIQLRNLEQDTFENVLESEFAVGDSGDVILLDGTEIQNYAKRGFLYPLNGTTLSKSLGETVIPLREMTEWNGYQWAMPFDFDTYVLAARSAFLTKSGLDTLPQREDQWIKLIQQASNAGTKLLSIDSDDIYATSAWLNHFEPGLAMNYMMNGEQGSLLEGEYQQELQLIEKIQPYLHLDAKNAESSEAFQQNIVPMTVMSLSRLLQENKTIVGDTGSFNQIAVTALLPVKSRSFVITTGSSETDGASRWIEGMTSAAVQLEWFQRAHYLPTKQDQMNVQSGKLASLFGKMDIKALLATNALPSKTEITYVPTGKVQQKIKQFIQGQISAIQYMNSIVEIRGLSK